MACWDIRGKAEGKPVYELLGGAQRPLAIRSRYSMGAYEPDRARARAKELVAAGFTTIKVKVGRDPAADVERVRAVREAIGPDIALTIDANCGWDADTAIRCIRELADCKLALVEQPTPDGDYAALARVRRETDVPVMADDICFNLVHARELVRNDVLRRDQRLSRQERRHPQGAARSSISRPRTAWPARSARTWSWTSPRRPWPTWSWPARTCRSKSIPATCWGPTITRFAWPRTRCRSKARSPPSPIGRAGRGSGLASGAGMPLRVAADFTSPKRERASSVVVVSRLSGGEEVSPCGSESALAKPRAARTSVCYNHFNCAANQFSPR